MLDKVTLNVGLRYDAQFLYGADGNLGLSLPNQWSPRVGVIYDFTESGRSKLFANYARYYENVPLDLADIALTGEPDVSRQPRPRQLRSAASPASSRALQGHRATTFQSTRPKPVQPQPQVYRRGALARRPIDPDIRPQSSDEIVLGGEYEVLAGRRLGRKLHAAAG